MLAAPCLVLGRTGVPAKLALVPRDSAKQIGREYRQAAGLGKRPDPRAIVIVPHTIDVGENEHGGAVAVHPCSLWAVPVCFDPRPVCSGGEGAVLGARTPCSNAHRRGGLGSSQRPVAHSKCVPRDETCQRSTGTEPRQEPHNSRHHLAAADVPGLECPSTAQPATTLPSTFI